MTSTSFGHTSKVLLVIFAAFYALLVAWCLFGQVSEEDAMAEYHDGGFSGASRHGTDSPFPTSVSTPSAMNYSSKRGFSGLPSGRSSSHGYRLRKGGGASLANYSGSLGSATGGAHGLYTTSSSAVHSYGGGVWSSTGNGYANRNTSRAASSDSDMAYGGWSPISAPALSQRSETELLAYTSEAEAAAPMFAPAAGSSATASVWHRGVSTAAATGWMSADDWLSGAQRSSGIRKGLPGTGGYQGDPIANWLASLAGSGLGGYSGTTDGIGYFDETTLKAYYESLCSNPDNMPGFTWDEVKAWFTQGGDNPIYSLINQNPTPVGDAWTLLLLALGYVLYKYLIEKQKRAQTELVLEAKKDQK